MVFESNRRRATISHSPAYKIRGTRPAIFSLVGGDLRLARRTCPYWCAPNKTFRNRSLARTPGCVRSIFYFSSFCRRSRRIRLRGRMLRGPSSFTNPSSVSANSDKPEKEISLESAPAPEERSAPMRRKSSSIWRLARLVVPVRNGRWRSFPRVLASDPQRLRYRSEKRARHEIFGIELGLRKNNFEAVGQSAPWSV